MKLIIGLGNPGTAYTGTRHNVGFDALDELATKLGWIDKLAKFNALAREKFFGLTLDGTVGRSGGGDEKVLLLKPLTYMNLSGKAVSAAMGFYQLAITDIMVVLDDLALPVGKIRIRAGGSSGGHNGLKDIERVLGSDQYPRLRIGIDPTPPRMAGKDYVLQKFSTEQQERLWPAMNRATAALVLWIEKGVGPAMSQYNADVKE